MCCEEVKQLLDAYIDGELSEAQMRALDEHAKACEACGQELAAARLLKETLAHMDDEIAVPLQAQAAWRSAVRSEAAKQKKKRWMRYASAAAAVFVLALGVNFAFDQPEPQQAKLAVRSVTADNADYALVASDGLLETAESAQCTVRRKISAESAQDAMQQLSQLAQEYSGSFTLEGDGACRIEIPGGYLEDFTKAASRIGEEIYSETTGEASETAVLLIQVTEG